MPHDMNANDVAASREGFKYFLIIIDDASRYRLLYFLKTKDEAYDRLVFWVLAIKNVGFKPLAAVRSDIESVVWSNR